jgi:hypothetical protein
MKLIEEAETRLQAFGWQSFKRIGASVLVNRLYRLVLTLFILIQLSFFFVATAMSLWVDQMYNGLFGSKGAHTGLYKAGHFIVFILLLPWLVLVSKPDFKGEYLWLILNRVGSQFAEN